MNFENAAARCTAMVRGDLGLIGFFEASNEPALVQSLLREAAAWLRAQGATQVIGPMDGDTWHRYRVNVGPFDEPPFLLEPTNPTYYASLWSPFQIIERYSSKRVNDIAPLIEKLAPMHERALRRGYRIRPFDVSELPLVWKLSLEIFKGNRFYSDISLEEFLKLYAGIDRLLLPELVLFAEMAGEPVGFLFAYPDSDSRTVDYKTIGVVPAHRRGYLGWALLHQAYVSALELGRPIANHCLMHESNASQSMDAGHGTTFREYYLYTL
ncbi:MAG TPA: GNAT family N-acetyltransferase [Thermoanaerobaculia bacterium]|nr:GNAT family N-acetyltransferase [Thermoanaerobaculia bacterium]